MHGPPDPKMRSPAAANGRASRNGNTQPQDTARSPLKLQAFCLARRFTFSAPLAEAIAPLIWGLRT
jgi:hypothetical protein